MLFLLLSMLLLLVRILLHWVIHLYWLTLVPIYDARNLPDDFIWSEELLERPQTQLPKMDQSRPPFVQGELPHESLVAVFYSVHYYTIRSPILMSEQLRISCNIYQLFYFGTTPWLRFLYIADVQSLFSVLYSNLTTPCIWYLSCLYRFMLVLFCQYFCVYTFWSTNRVLLWCYAYSISTWSIYAVYYLFLTLYSTCWTQSWPFCAINEQLFKVVIIWVWI